MRDMEIDKAGAAISRQGVVPRMSYMQLGFDPGAGSSFFESSNIESMSGVPADYSADGASFGEIAGGISSIVGSVVDVGSAGFSAYMGYEGLQMQKERQEEMIKAAKAERQLAEKQLALMQKMADQKGQAMMPPTRFTDVPSYYGANPDFRLEKENKWLPWVIGIGGLGVLGTVVFVVTR